MACYSKRIRTNLTTEMMESIIEASNAIDWDEVRSQQQDEPDEEPSETDEDTEPKPE